MKFINSPLTYFWLFLLSKERFDMEEFVDLVRRVVVSSLMALIVSSSVNKTSLKDRCYRYFE
jgi:hypothetical protein